MHGRERYRRRDLNKTELRVVELVAQGLKNSEVAEIICTTEMVIKNYLRDIYDKLGLWNRVEVALRYEARRHREVMN
jgi:two-component system nitrate/nitrite response regulator NarL